MPFIQVYAHKGRDKETQQKAAVAIVKAASEVMGAPLSAFTVVYEDFEPEVYEKEVKKPIMEPLRDKMILEQGELV